MERQRKQTKRLNYEDRKKIERLYSSGARIDEIAAKIDVAAATIYRELKRGGEPYKAEVAQKSI